MCVNLNCVSTLAHQICSPQVPHVSLLDGSVAADGSCTYQLLSPARCLFVSFVSTVTSSPWTGPMYVSVIRSEHALAREAASRRKDNSGETVKSGTTF